MAAIKKEKRPSLTIEGATLMFKNFSGAPTKYNAGGKRSFNLVLDPELAAQLKKDGWNIRELEPRDDTEDPVYITEIRISYQYRAPKVVMIKGNKKQNLDEESIGILDWARIVNADVKVTPSHWSMPTGEEGWKGYLDVLFVTIEEDELEKKYAYLDEISEE